MQNLLRRHLVILLLGALAPLTGCEKADKEARLPWVATPELALEKINSTPVFYSPAARRWLLEKRPDLLEADDRGKDSERSKSFAQAVEDPRLFRQLDRQQRFSTLLLTGDPSESRPLLEHLLETRDFQLAYLDHTSLIFRRDVKEKWTPAQLDGLRARLGSVSPKVRARLLGEIGTKLVAVRELAPARELIAEAQKADAGVPQVWTAQGNYRMAQGDWKGAIESAQKALEIDPESLPALGVLAQSYFASKQFMAAYEASSKIVAKLPESPSILFYHAKIAHEAKQKHDEIRVLQKLIAMAEKAHRPTSVYEVYLGQAYSTSGDGERGLAEFEKALKDPELPTDHRRFAQECVRRLRDMAEQKEAAAAEKKEEPKPGK
jgi:tetratricopeptide (TPR) repeat protein